MSLLPDQQLWPESMGIIYDRVNALKIHCTEILKRYSTEKWHICPQNIPAPVHTPRPENTKRTVTRKPDPPFLVPPVPIYRNIWTPRIIYFNLAEIRIWTSQSKNFWTFLKYFIPTLF